MKRLMDIAPADVVKKPVTVNSKDGPVDIEVGRIGSKRLTGLLVRYPELGDMMAEKKVAPLRMIEIAADAAAALIAAGCGYYGDEAPAAEAFAAELDIADQLKLVEAIVVMTFPPMAPLVEQLKSRVETFLAELQKVEVSPIEETPPTD
ncbi:hypothetical protein [Mesorhizobium sp. M7A.F.Ce.TU.012.03.2.1]|uniref:hypothetical protein n=1 Tax=Mesorhizobium sp. M7A.F.Ce.TU.012.03.2.1 TaxID=2493681 RepID=UPI000FD83E49|nr:hypothetical protein [Mesorhizobium sp. M7A.F.Ce.TU.012.03.2.1]AZV21475.1 hypothetical protein EJ079_21775 [Mesorhizobium sp. M7A.F.Ce.TU.012.03.2.1]